MSKMIKRLLLDILFFTGILTLSLIGYAQKGVPILVLDPVSNQRVVKTAKNRINNYFSALLDIDKSLKVLQLKAVAYKEPAPIKKAPPKIRINPRIVRAEKLLERGKKLINKKRYEPAVRVLYSAVNLLKRNLADLEDFNTFVQARLWLALAFAMANYRDEASASIRIILTIRPEFFLDKGQYPAKFVRFFNRIRNRFKKKTAGNINIHTKVEDAKIFCDGKLAGTGSATISGLQRGRHYIRIVADGYKNKAFRTYTPAAGKEKKLTATLKPLTGKKKARKTVSHAVNVKKSISILLGLVREGNFNAKFRRISKGLTGHYKAPFLVTGYITEASEVFHLAIFVYRAKDNRLFQLDPVLIGDDMGNLQVAVLDLESALSKFVSGKNTGRLVTARPAIYAIAPPPPPKPVPTPKPAPVVAAQTVKPKPVSKPKTEVTIIPMKPVATTAPAKTAPSVHITELPAGFPMTGSEGPAIRPWYKKWWVWTIVGVAVVGAGIGTYFGVSASHSSGGFSTNVNWTPY